MQTIRRSNDIRSQKNKLDFDSFQGIHFFEILNYESISICQYANFIGSKIDHLQKTLHISST